MASPENASLVGRREEFFKDGQFQWPQWAPASASALRSYQPPVPKFAFLRHDLGDGREDRLIYLADFAVGHGTIHDIDVFVLAPGVDYSETAINPPANTITDVDPKIVDVVITSYNGPRFKAEGYPVTTVPEDFQFPADDQPDRDARKLLEVGLGSVMEQFPFVFGDQLYFVFGGPLVYSSVVYTITTDLRLAAVCVTSTTENLEEMKRAGIWP